MESVNVRNLENIQEDEPGRRSPRLGTLLLFALGGGALVAVAALSMKSAEPAQRSEDDPLAQLVSEAKHDSKPAEEVDEADVTFPGILSDTEAPTTALAAVKDERGRLLKQDFTLPAGAPTLPPPPTDSLPVVPLPAGSLLAATPVTEQPKDRLTGLAASQSQVAEGGALAPMGSEGGYQIQVASFDKQEDADKFVSDLRKRGHEAYRQAAHVPGRGLWHRVRIGPFKTKFQAQQYKDKFEKTERVSPFLVDPHKQKLQEDIKQAKIAARKRRMLGTD